LTGVSYADGGGVKSVGNDYINDYCEQTLPKIATNYNGPEINGRFIAHQDKNGFTAHVFLEGTQYGVQRVSQIGKIYTIYVVNGDDYKDICKYTNGDLMERYIDYACKRQVDKDFGYAEKTVFPSIISISKTNEANCESGLDDPEKMPMIAGEVIIKISPLK
jgi:hypothetical protein